MKICPQCESEFQDWAERCLDCGATLKADHEMPTLSESSGDVCLASGDEATLKLLSAALRADGIPTRLVEESDEWGLWLRFLGVMVRFKRPRTHRLYVAEEDVAEAEGYGREILGEASLEPRPVVFGEGLCPACGAEVADSAEACLECGLVLESPTQPPDLTLSPVDRLGLPSSSTRSRRR